MSRLSSLLNGLLRQDNTDIGMISASLEQLNSLGNSTGNAPKALAGKAFAHESMSTTDISDVKSYTLAVKTTLLNIAKEHHFELNKQFEAIQLYSACSGNLMASAPAAYAKSLSTENMDKSIQALNSTNVSIIPYRGMDATPRHEAFAKEAYENKDPRQAINFTTMYNLLAPRQDEFGEAFFPTITLTPDNMGLFVGIRLNYVIDDTVRKLSGEAFDNNRVNVLKAFVDPTILNNDSTKIVPIVQQGNTADTNNTKFFVDKTIIPYSNVELFGESVTTSPLRIGMGGDLIGLSQTDYLITNNGGVLDYTDTLDTACKLTSLYLLIPGNPTANPVVPNKVIRFDTTSLSGSDFAYAVQGNSRQMNLNAQFDNLLINSNTKLIDGTATDLPVGLYDTYISVNISGSVTLDKANITVNAGNVSINRVMDSNKQKLDLTVTDGLALENALANAKIIGYTVNAWRSNANRRLRGQLIDTQQETRLYSVPLLPPVTSMRPVGQDDANDAAQISSLVETTKVRIANSAVTKLLELKDQLAEYVGLNPDANNANPDLFGIGSKLLQKAFYVTEPLNVAAQVDSLKSADRAKDITELLINKVRDIAYRAYQQTGFQIATSALFEGASPKPLVIIGTDPYLARYLTLHADERTMGDLFDVKIVTSNDIRVRGKIFITLGFSNTYGSGAPNPLHFGFLAWKPELVLALPIARRGQISYEQTVQPSYRHDINCPILGVIEVTGIESVIAAKVAIDNHVV